MGDEMTDDSKKLHTRKWVEKQIRDYRSLIGPENDAQDRWINDGFRNEILNLQAELAEIDLLDNPDADLLDAARAANTRCHEVMREARQIAGQAFMSDATAAQRTQALKRIFALLELKPIAAVEDDEELEATR